ncbi:N-acyltransferase YncA [Pelotomaculum schinkii]|uniref:N-acyltransferase YncA n=1 Tax=Pelotomaculum schinkii TaxID=78350 RepID=A0A4Y7RB50_9FIRM|nr:GNAT family N-acetyltransferase [Pelotomaculum schinkii]TEB06052.1 N-acyltransferase YncA [Pelotomaculum schinkii]
MSYSFAPLNDEYRKPVIDIFNYYIENSFAAFPEQKLSYNYFDMLLNATAGYPAIVAETEDGEVIGFALLRPYHPMPVFKRVAEVTYFIKPEHTGKGIGRSMLEYLSVEAQKIGIDSILACISSLNENSLNFHHRNGFQHSGTLYNIGRKFNRDFSVHLMQKTI